MQVSHIRIALIGTLTSAVRIPESIPLVSVSRAASRRLAAILRHASDTAVASGSVSALVNRSFFTVLSSLRGQSISTVTPEMDDREGFGMEETGAHDAWTGEVGLDDDVDAFPSAAGGGRGGRRGCEAERVAIIASSSSPRE